MARCLGDFVLTHSRFTSVEVGLKGMMHWAQASLGLRRGSRKGPRKPSGSCEVRTALQSGDRAT